MTPGSNRGSPGPLRDSLRRSAVGFGGVVLCVAALSLANALLQAQARPPGMEPPITWARIPAGTFQMGCVPADERCGSDEEPRHAVQLTRPFDLMTTEVTIAMYRARSTEVDEQPLWSTSPRHPVVSVTWTEAQAFCDSIGGRLPTEAEWEYAARGGRESEIFPWGNDAPLVRIGTSRGAAFEGDSAHPVGTFGANGFGLFDMAGNVWEWVADWASAYEAEAETDPPGFPSGRVRIVRGGSYGDDPGNLRISNRTPNQPASVNLNVGFRCAKNVVK